MAERYAVASGNWSDVATWDGGTTLPGASDDVYSNNFTVTIDQDVTVLSIRNTAGATASAGGGFTLQDGWTVTADLYSNTNVTLLTYSGATSAAIVGDIKAGGTSSVSYGVSHTGGGALSITGDCATAASGGYGVRHAGAGSTTITGNVTGGTGTNQWMVTQTAGTVTIVGDVTGGSGNSTSGVIKTGGALTITGDVAGSPTNNLSVGVQSTSGKVSITGTCTGAAARAVSASGGFCCINGDAVAGAAGDTPVYASALLIHASTEIVHTYRVDNSGSPGAARSLYTGGVNLGNPAATDVRSGTTFGPSSEYTGSLAVPAAQYVSQGVSVDATVGTLTGAGTLAAGTAQGGTSTTIQLAASETFGDDILNGNIVKITGGTGAGQSRRITDYVGATDTATVSEAWITTPDNTSTYEVVEGSHVTGISAAEVNAEVVDVINVDTLVAGVTVAEALRRIGAVCAGEISGAGTGTETVTPWDAGAETVVFTVDSSGNRTAVAFN